MLNVLVEVKTALGVLDVLNADVDALGQVAVLDALVDNDTKGALAHVVDATWPGKKARVDLAPLYTHDKANGDFSSGPYRSFRGSSCGACQPGWHRCPTEVIANVA